MGDDFDGVYLEWLERQIDEETNPRRREFLQKGLSRGTTDFLRFICYPVIGNFKDLYPEYEVATLIMAIATSIWLIGRATPKGASRFRITEAMPGISKRGDLRICV